MLFRCGIVLENQDSRAPGACGACSVFNLCTTRSEMEDLYVRWTRTSRSSICTLASISANNTGAFVCYIGIEFVRDHIFLRRLSNTDNITMRSLLPIYLSFSWTKTHTHTYTTRHITHPPMICCHAVTWHDVMGLCCARISHSIRVTVLYDIVNGVDKTITR